MRFPLLASMETPSPDKAGGGGKPKARRQHRNPSYLDINMKQILTTLLILFAMTAVNVQSKAQSAGNSADSGNTLTMRQKMLGAVACLEAQGDLPRLATAINQALDAGATVNELKEALSQLYAYTGFPRSLNALNTLRTVIADRKAKNLPVNEGKPWSRPKMWDNAEESLRIGTEVQTKVSGAPFTYDFCPQDDYYLKAHLFGDIFAGDQLSHSDRELVTVGALMGLEKVDPQLESHKRGAVNMGNSQEQVDELVDFLNHNGYTLKGEWPKGNPNTAYAQYFIRDSYLASLAPVNLKEGEKTVLPMSNVTFEPGCRNNWHIHHGAHQILICVSGKGWYQEWGKPAIALKPGDVVDIPEGVKHWHGAQRDSWFQHIATHVAVSDKQSNEWLEPVSDEEYNKLK